VERYEELVKEQMERLERAKRNSGETEKFQRDAKSLKERR
jgi:hypothetical protein